MRRTAASRQQGFSLAESVVAVGLVAGMLRLAMPPMQEMVHAASLRGATSDLVSDLVQARAEALRRNRRVALCKSAAGIACDDQGGWEQGWIMFHDTNGNGEAEPDEEVISRREALPPQFRLQGNQPVGRYISYTALGATRLTGGGFQAGTLTLCRVSPTPTEGRQIVLNAMGRPRAQKAALASCA